MRHRLGVGALCALAASAVTVVLLPQSHDPPPVGESRYVRAEAAPAPLDAAPHEEKARDRAVSRRAVDARPPHQLTCRVIDSTGAPVQWAEVEVVRGTEVIARRVVDGRGEAAFDGLRAGHYAVELVAASLPADFLSADPGPLVEIARQGALRVERVVRRAARVFGVVRDPRGTAVSGAVVLHCVDPPTRVLRGATDARGVFELDSVPPGTYHARASHGDPSAAWGPSSPRLVEVREGAVEVLQLTLQRAPCHLTGRLVDAEGRAVASARLAAVPFGSPSRGGGVVPAAACLAVARTGVDGAFALGPLPAAHVALAVDPRGGWITDLGSIDLTGQRGEIGCAISAYRDQPGRIERLTR